MAVGVEYPLRVNVVQFEVKTLPRANNADDWSRAVLEGLGKSHSCLSCKFVPRGVCGTSLLNDLRERRC